MAIQDKHPSSKEPAQPVVPDYPSVNKEAPPDQSYQGIGCAMLVFACLTMPAIKFGCDLLMDGR